MPPSWPPSLASLGRASTGATTGPKIPKFNNRTLSRRDDAMETMMTNEIKRPSRPASAGLPKVLRRVTDWLKTSAGRQLLVGGLATMAAVVLGRNKRVRAAAVTVGKEARDAAVGAMGAVKRAGSTTKSSLKK